MIAARSLGAPKPRLSSGCALIDEFLGGGVPVGVVTEFAGEATAGKSNLCLQLMTTVQWPAACGGLHGSALYLYTEAGKPFSRRLEAMSEGLLARATSVAAATGAGAALPAGPAADRIFVQDELGVPDDLLHCLHQARRLLEHPQDPDYPVRLIVLDSVAGVFRDDGNDAGDVGGRARQMFEAAALLKRFADEFALAVVITNQVADKVEDVVSVHQQGAHGALRTSGRDVMPALGLAWANCVNQRIFLARLRSGLGADTGGDASVRREMSVLFSPTLPPRKLEFVIGRDGLRGVPASAGG
ncbi:unnamed protein product [Pedinophyceae sp. YPF-701]|nr:unnamed protein product [Pedinophyceae sp. YPF-701]